MSSILPNLVLYYPQSQSCSEYWWHFLPPKSFDSYEKSISTLKSLNFFFVIVDFVTFRFEAYFITFSVGRDNFYVAKCVNRHPWIRLRLHFCVRWPVAAVGQGLADTFVDVMPPCSPVWARIEKRVDALDSPHWNLFTFLSAKSLKVIDKFMYISRNLWLDTDLQYFDVRKLSKTTSQLVR